MEKIEELKLKIQHVKEDQTELRESYTKKKKGYLSIQEKIALESFKIDE